MRIKQFIRHHSLMVYFLLTFIISWGLVIVLSGSGNIPINPEKSQDLLLLLYVSMLLGPGISGILMVSLTDGKAGFRKLISHLFKWRVNIWWYILALFATPVLAFLVLLILSVMSSEFQTVLPSSNSIVGLILNGIFIGVMVGIFEEFGWTGFAIPRLIQSYNILISGLILGILWGGWHFILFWERDSFSGILPFFILIGSLFAWLPPFRVFMVWIYSRTESLLLTILTHMSLVFTTNIIVPMTLTGKSLLIWVLTWGAILWIAIILILVENRKISLKQSINLDKDSTDLGTTPDKRS